MSKQLYSQSIPLCYILFFETEMLTMKTLIFRLKNRTLEISS